MTTTDYLPNITPAAIGWPVEASLPAIDHTGAEWCQHAICEPMRDVDGSITSLKTLAVYETAAGDRVEVVRRDEWTVAVGWTTGSTRLVGMSGAALREEGPEIVAAALRVGVEMGRGTR